MGSNASLKLIHVGKRELCMDDESYRLLLKDMFSVGSAKDLSESQRGELLDRFKKLGFKPTPKKSYPGKPKNFSNHDPMAKVEALLADMGLPWAYADSIAKRQFGIEKMAWIKMPHQFTAIIAALHVEQEKIQLLARFTEVLAKRDMTIEQFETQYSEQLKKGWKRNRNNLKTLINQFLDVEAG